MAFALAAVLLLVQPLQELVETETLNEAKPVGDTAAAFAMIFIGTEASERLKEHWRPKKPGGGR